MVHDTVKNVLDLLVGLLSTQNIVGKNGAGTYTGGATAPTQNDVFASLLSSLFSSLNQNIVGRNGAGTYGYGYGGAAPVVEPSSNVLVGLLTELIASRNAAGANGCGENQASVDAISGLPDVISSVDKILIGEIFKGGDLNDSKLNALTTLFQTLDNYLTSFQSKIATIKDATTSISVKKSTVAELETQMYAWSSTRNNGFANKNFTGRRGTTQASADAIAGLPEVSSSVDKLLITEIFKGGVLSDGKLNTLTTLFQTLAKFLTSFQAKIATIKDATTSISVKKSTVAELEAGMYAWALTRNSGLKIGAMGTSESSDYCIYYYPDGAVYSAPC